MTTPSYFPLPAGTTDQRPPDPQVGYIRYNITVGKIEVYNGLAWTNVILPGLRRIKDLDLPPEPVGDQTTVIIDQLSSEEALDYTTYRMGLYDLFYSQTVSDYIREISAAYLSVQNVGGFGNLSYDNVGGIFYYQGIVDSEIWGVMGVEGPNLAYDSGTGVYSFTSDPVFDTVTTEDLYVENIIFTGTGAVNFSSNNDLTFTAEGRIVFRDPIHLPRYSQAELAALPDAGAGAVAICTDPLLGGARPVYFDGTVWRDFANGDIDIIDDF